MNKNITFHYVYNLAHNSKFFFGYLSNIQHIFTFIYRHYISCYGFYNIPKWCHHSSEFLVCMGIIILQSWGKVSVFVTLSEDWRMYQASGSARSASPGITCAHAPVSSCRGQNWGPPEAGLSTDALADVTAGHAWVDARLGGGALPFPLLGEKDAEGTKLLTVMAQQMEERETDWRSPEKKPFANHFWMCVSF